MDAEQMGPQTFLYGCELKEGKEVTFNPEDDDFEHQLSIRMACVDPAAKDELNVVEVEGQDAEGQAVKAILATLKPSTMPSVCLGGFEISPPVVFRLRTGSGPVHISGQHLIMISGDQSFDEDDEEEEDMRTALKRGAPAAVKPSKKMKLEEEEEDDDEEDDDDDDEDEDEDDEDEEESEEETPVKAKKLAAKPQTSAQNGKSNTPAPKLNKTPDAAKKNEKKPQTPKSPKTPKTPQAPLSIPEIKAKMMATVEKGVSLPKLQPKFENYVKNGFKVTDTKVINELWQWRQTVKN